MKLLWIQLQSEVKGKIIPIELSESDKDTLLPPLYKVELIDSESTIVPSHSTIHFLPKPNGALNKQVIKASIKSNTRITAEDHFQDTRHLVL